MSISKVFDMCNNVKYKYKKHSCKYCLQCFSSKRDLVEHRKACLKTNGKRIVKLKGDAIKFKYHFKQLAKLFEIHSDFWMLKGFRASDRNNNTLRSEKYQVHIFGSFAYKFVCVDDRFSKPVVPYRGRNEVYTFIEKFLESMIIAKSDKKAF